MADDETPLPWDEQLRELAAQARETAVSRARDAAAVSIGLGLLGVNRAQALRRDVVSRLSPDPRPGGPSQSGSGADEERP